MANLFRKGIFPADSQRIEYRLCQIAAASATAMFVGDVVSAITGGTVSPTVAGDNAIVLGTCVELYDNGGTNPVPGQNPPIPVGMWSSSVSQKYLPALTAGYALVAVAKPGVKFVAVTNTILTATAINKSTALVAGAGNTTVATSGHVLNGGDLNTGNQFIILGPFNQLIAAAGMYNDITLANALWLVEFNEGLNFGVGKATGV